MQIQAFVASDTGRVRKHNEDSYCLDEALGLYLVCDGMGGHAAGEVASKAAVNAVVRVLHEQRDWLEACDGSPETLERAGTLLHEALQEASRSIYEIASSDRGKHGMGTTSIALLVVGDKALAANVGDSRLYLVRDGQLHQLSTDHNFLNEVVARGVMTREQAEHIPQAHVLTRAVGVQPTVPADLLAFDVLPGDTFLLCSDGLYEYASDARALAELLSEPELASIPRRLVQQALDGGGHDNATALVVRALGADAHEQERKSVVTRQLDALHEIELFRELALAELVKVYGLFASVRVEPGEAVIREGDAGEHLFVVVEGRCEVARAGTTIATLGPGTHFGEMALLNQRPRSATVIARERMRLLRLSRTGYRQLLEREPGIALKFLTRFARTLSLRLDDTYLARDFRAGRETLGLGGDP